MSRSTESPLVLPRPALGVQVDELERIFKRQVRKLANGVLSQPHRTALDNTAKADVRVCKDDLKDPAANPALTASKVGHPAKAKQEDDD